MKNITTVFLVLLIIGLLGGVGAMIYIDQTSNEEEIVFSDEEIVMPMIATSTPPNTLSYATSTVKTPPVQPSVPSTRPTSPTTPTTPVPAPPAPVIPVTPIVPKPVTTPSTPTTPTKPTKPTPPSKVARLSVEGSQVIDPQGNPIVLTGFNWGEWGAAQEQDAKDNVNQGANVVRMPLSWYYGDGTTDTTCQTGQDSYDPTAPGNIKKENLALIDQQVRWAVSQKLWTIVMVRGGDCDFWTNPKIIPEYAEMWKFLANRYKDVPYIAGYELLSEPHPPRPFTNEDMKRLYSKAIESVRSVDPNVPVIIGPAKAYDIRNLEFIYMPNFSNVIYTTNFYELPAYVKQGGEGNNGVQEDMMTGYPGTYQDQGNDTYGADDDCVYPGKGQEVYLNKQWMAGLLSCATSFRDKHQVPIFVNQIGLRTIAPDSKVYVNDVLSLFKQNNIGFTYWTYRSRNNKSDLLDKDAGVLYERDDGVWAVKQDWLSLVSSYF